MTKTLGTWLHAVIAIPLVVAPLRGQSVLLGSVVADGDPSPPLFGADVSIPALNLAVRTDSLGQFAIRGIPKGSFRINVRHVGYNTIAVDGRFAGTDTIAADFALIPVAVGLDTVRVVGSEGVHGKFLEFEDRRAHGSGAFLTRADLEKDKDRQLGEILAKLPGVRINRYGSESAVASARWSGGAGRGGDAMDRMKGAPRGCYAQVYVDNMRVFSANVGEALFNINSIAPSTIQGIEYYPSRAQTPIQYATSRAECGTILIWTRIE